MTKAELVEHVSEKIGGPKKVSQDVVEAIFELMKDTLHGGDKIKISGFGNFILRDKRPRKGRNPQTGDDIEITARRVLTFRPSQILKQYLNEAPPSAGPENPSAGG